MKWVARDCANAQYSSLIFMYEVKGKGYAPETM